MNWLSSFFFLLFVCLKWDPCERRERRETGVFRAAHPHTLFGAGKILPVNIFWSNWENAFMPSTKLLPNPNPGADLGMGWSAPPPFSQLNHANSAYFTNQFHPKFWPSAPSSNPGSSPASLSSPSWLDKMIHNTSAVKYLVSLHKRSLSWSWF